MRNLPTGLADYFESSHVKPILLAEMFFASGTVRMWSGVGTITWNGNDYLGGGQFIGVSPIEETQDLIAKGIVVSLNGIQANLIALALSEGQTRGRPFRLYLGSFTDQDYIIAEYDLIVAENGDQLVSEGGETFTTEGGENGIISNENGSLWVTELSEVSEPYRIFSGIMDVPEYSTNGKTADIRLAVENVLIIGQRAKLSRYTDEDQRKRYPNDKGLEFINQLQDKEIVW